MTWFFNKYKMYKSAYLLLRAWVSAKEDLERAILLDNLESIDKYEDDLFTIEEEIEVFVLLNT